MSWTDRMGMGRMAGHSCYRTNLVEAADAARTKMVASEQYLARFEDQRARECFLNLDFRVHLKRKRQRWGSRRDVLHMLLAAGEAGHSDLAGAERGAPSSMWSMLEEEQHPQPAHCWACLPNSLTFAGQPASAEWLTTRALRVYTTENRTPPCSRHEDGFRCVQGQISTVLTSELKEG